jgi:formamidopyrimidine-DNA glycosylase
MPELPDLTIYAENLRRAVVGKKIVKVSCTGTRLDVSADELSESLRSNEIIDVQRVGKEIGFQLSNGIMLRIHLMLTGGFLLTTEKKAEDADSTVFALCFADGSALVVTDPKGWAKISLNPKAGAEAPDALDVTVDYLEQRFRKQPKMLIKAFLVDQKLIQGIGNAYADEILWVARVSPKSVVGKLPPEAMKSLVKAIPAVLNEAIDYLRKHHGDMVAGEFREFLKVHGPNIKKSPTGAPVIKEQVASKKTYFTEEQTLYS